MSESARYDPRFGRRHRVVHPATLTTLRMFRREASSRSFRRLPARKRPNSRPSARGCQTSALRPPGSGREATQKESRKPAQVPTTAGGDGNGLSGHFPIQPSSLQNGRDGLILATIVGLCVCSEEIL